MVSQPLNTAQATDPADAAPARQLSVQAEPRPKAVPSWVISVAFHATVLVLLGWVFETDGRTRGITVEEGARETGIVLKSVSNSQEFYEDGSDSAVESPVDAENPTASNAVSALPNTEDVALDPSDLPSALGVIGPGEAEPGGGITNPTEGAPQPSGNAAKGGYAKVNIYGAEAEGSKFVFVFDRSVSMDGEPIASAKRELLNGIQALQKTHQFEIIFFNHEPRIFDLTGNGRLAFADDQAKKLAANFVGGITAAGNTDRMKALRKALGVAPDVIFFLTDADDPLSADELASIKRLAKSRTSINTIEFGYGPNPGGTNFLTRMAAENNGKYVYVDTSLLER